jgi:multidrug efflux pump subunit AcrA (membrane-fusion protein)
MVLSTEVAGKVKEVLVDVGDEVPKNGKVACLDQVL